MATVPTPRPMKDEPEIESGVDGKTQAELDAGFEDFQRKVRSDYRAITGRDFDTGLPIGPAASTPTCTPLLLLILAVGLFFSGSIGGVVMVYGPSSIHRVGTLLMYLGFGCSLVALVAAGIGFIFSPSRWPNQNPSQK